MTATASATLLDPGRWTGKIFNGEWIPSGGGERTVVEPAKGAKLGAAGMASVDDVRRAAERAAEAQREWARLPFLARAAVLRRAAQLWQENAGELVDWIVRESGAIGPFAGFQLHVAESECWEAAAQAGSTIPVDVNFMLNGRRMVGVTEGDSDPEGFIPALVALWQQGRFPIDRMMKKYPFEDIDKAAHDAHSGAVIKAVLTFQ